MIKFAVKFMLKKQHYKIAKWLERNEVKFNKSGRYFLIYDDSEKLRAKLKTWSERESEIEVYTLKKEEDYI